MTLPGEIIHASRQASRETPDVDLGASRYSTAIYVVQYYSILQYTDIYIYTYMCQLDLSIAKSVTLNCYCFVRQCDLHMYCILFRVSVYFGVGIVYAGCLHDLPAKGHHIEQHTNDYGQQKPHTTTLNTFDL